MINTQTNVIASIPDFNIVLKVLKDYSKGLSLDQIKESLVVTNAYGIRTKESRVRFYTAIKSTFLQFRNRDHQDIIKSIYRSEFSTDIQRFIAYMQMSINNELFFHLTNDVLIGLLFKGRLTIDKPVFVSYLHDIMKENNDIIQWTDSTIETIAYKYLTLMKKLGFLRGSVKKEFNRFSPTDEMLILSVYLIKSVGMEYPNFLQNPYSALLMLPQNSLIERLRRMTFQDSLSITTVGYDMKMDLKYSYKEIANAVRKNY